MQNSPIYMLLNLNQVSNQEESQYLRDKHVSSVCCRAQGDISPLYISQTNTTRTQHDVCGEQMKVSSLHSFWRCAVGPRGCSQQSGTYTTLPQTNTQ